MSRRLACDALARWPRSAPAQNAGPLPVMITARQSSSCSSQSNVETMSPAISSLIALRRSGSSRVTTAMPSVTLLWTTGMSALALSDHGGGMAEELLDVALVPVGRLGRPDRPAQPHGLDEGLDGAGGRVVVAEPGL